MYELELPFKTLLYSTNLNLKSKTLKMHQLAPVLFFYLFKTYQSTYTESIPLIKDSSMLLLWHEEV